jgi:hypothetical protein
VDRVEEHRVEDRRQLLVRNLTIGAVLGAGIGVLQVVSSTVPVTNAVLVGNVIGGALGGAVLLLLASAVLRWLFK